MKHLLLTFLSFFYMSAQLYGNWFCRTHENETECETDGCVWDDPSQKCLNDKLIIGSNCFEAKAPDSCTELGCYWSTRYETCYDGDNCSELTEESNCVQFSGCLWDGGSCLDNGWFNKSSAFEVVSQEACKKLKYNWYEKSGCFETTKCAYARTEKDCNSNNTCLWAKSASTCFEKSNKICGYLSESECKEKISSYGSAKEKYENLCAWDDTSVSCSPLHNTSFPDLDIPKKQKTTLENALQSVNTSLEDVIRLTTSTCFLHNQKPSCSKDDKNCFWDAQNRRCFDKHTPFCSYVSNDTCEESLSCKFDKERNICIPRNLPCHEIREKQLCEEQAPSKQCYWIQPRSSQFGSCRGPDELNSDRN